MKQPIQDLTVYVSPFGGEIELYWKPREDENEEIIIFKSTTQITQPVIDQYFLSNSLPESIKLTVIGNDYNAFLDSEVKNGTKYYYCIIAASKDKADKSAAVFSEAIPQPSLKLKVIDSKDVVSKAIVKMLDNIYGTDGRKVELGRDIKIVKNFSIDPISDNWIMLERVNGSTQYKFWANEIASIKGRGTIKGDIDADVIRMTFVTLHSSERRDTVYNIFKANKQTLIRLCKKLGAINCDISLEGDYYNPQVHGVNATGFICVFNLLTEQNALIPKEQLTNLIGDITVGEQE